MTWFSKITGFLEGDYRNTQARLCVVDGLLVPEGGGQGYAVGQLDLVSLATLRNQARAVKVAGHLTLGIVQGNVRHMHADPENRGAVFQVASQFNLLEMSAPSVTPEHGVTRYENDMTQGPACAMAAGAGTIWRNYLVPVGNGLGQTADRQIDALAGLSDALARDLGGAQTALWQMRNGYALPDRSSLARIEEYLAALTDAQRDDLRGLLRIGLHQDVGVTEAAAKTLVTQAYCLALPVAYSSIPAVEWTGFATLILEAAYEATLLAAVLNAARGASRKVLLTRIGGGAFGNNEEWISAAILRALRIVADQGLEVMMVSYGPPSAALRQVETTWHKEQSFN